MIGRTQGFLSDGNTEWAKYNITVNAIGPAYFESEMTQSVIGDEDIIIFVV